MEEVLTQLEKIVRSREFVRSERLARFLRFTVEQALHGRAADLKESVIGAEVFDRKTGYDPRLDPIVRVEARRLRVKLRRYYENEGRGDRVRIEYPTGSYCPVFCGPVESPPPMESARTTERGIAVLPFRNLSADPENEYFADGLAEELINELAKVEGLRVVAARSALRLKGREHDPAEVRNLLHVDYILEGSVRSSESRVRVTARLVDAGAGHTLWSETYDRKMADLFQLQEELACAIAGALRIRFAAPRRPAAARKESLEVYNLYLKGRHHAHARTEPGLHRSIDCYYQAIALEPGYAQAYAALSDSWALLSQYGLVRPHDVMPKAIEHANKALALDPTLEEAHTSLGLVKCIYEWKWAEAGEHFRRALELNPNYAIAHDWYAYEWLSTQGRLDEALVHIRRAAELDPLSLITLASTAGILLMRREYGAAMEESRKLLDLEPNSYRAYSTLGRAVMLAGDIPRSIELFRKAHDLSGGMPYLKAVLAHARAAGGDTDGARHLYGQLLNLSTKRHVPRTSLALVAMGLNDFDRAFYWLEQAAEEREGHLVFLNLYPTYEPLRSDPRFNSLIDRMGLPRRSEPASGRSY